MKRPKTVHPREMDRVRPVGRYPVQKMTKKQLVEAERILRVFRAMDKAGATDEEIAKALELPVELVKGARYPC